MSSFNPATDTQVPASHLALERLYHWEQHSPQNIAFSQPVGGGVVRDFTWREALEETRRMAAWLQAQGFEPGAKVAILSKNTAWWLMADWAIWMAGYVSVPLYPTLAADTIAQILAHSESRALFVGKLDGFDDMRSGIPQGMPCVRMPLSPEDAPGLRWEDISSSTAPLGGNPVRPADELCTLMYTSGTTGTPKGVMHSFGTFAWSVASGLKRVPMRQDTRMLSYLPLSHVAERVLVEHGQLATGMRVWFAESLDTFAADLQRARPTTFFSVPRLWVKFQQGVHAKMPPAKLDKLLGLPLVGWLVRRKIQKALGLDQCEFAAGGAAPMPPDLLRWYAKLGLEVMEVYGMTENCGLSQCTIPGQPRPGTVGPNHVGVETRIDMATGEIQMRHPGVMLGYYKSPEQTRETFTDDGWLKTGDQGQFDAEGNLSITGRIKDLFKSSKGKYIAPAPIEDKLVTHAAVEACCVVGANMGQPLALAMLNPEAARKASQAEGRAELEASMAGFLKTLNAQLDPHEQLDCVVLMTEAWTVANDLITPTFKVKRNQVDKAFGHHYEGWVRLGKPVLWAY